MDTPPPRRVTARRLAPRQIGRSVGATHEMIGRFSAAGLIGRRTRLAAAARPVLGDRRQLARRQLAATADPHRGVATHVDAGAGWFGPTNAPPRWAAHVSPLRANSPPVAYVGSPRRGLRRLNKGSVDHDAPTNGAGCARRRSTGYRSMASTPRTATTPSSWRTRCSVRRVHLAADPARGREIVEDWGIVPGPIEDGHS